MKKEDLISLSPIRIYDSVTNGGLKEGEMGLVTAKKGLGKTSVLVQFGIDSLLKEKHVVHISFDQHSSNVIAWYDSILAELAKKKHVEISDLTEDIVRERTIVNFNQETFNLPKVVKTIQALRDGGINVKTLVIDGLDLEKTGKADLDCVFAYVKEAGLTVWFSYTNEAENLSEQLSSDKLECFAQVSHLFSNGKDLFMKVLKPVEGLLCLDSKTTLITK